MFISMFDRIKKWLKRPFSYRSELALALACKFLLLYGLWALCFSIPAAVPVDDERVAQVMLEKSGYAAQP
jgi:hypothetical protein